MRHMNKFIAGVFVVVVLLFAEGAHAQNQTVGTLKADKIGVGTATPGTLLDVAGDITLRETTAIVATNAVTIPDGYSQVRLTGAATALISVTAPTAPANAGKRLVIYNNTTGGFAAIFAGMNILNGNALEFVYSNSTWEATTATTPDATTTATGKVQLAGDLSGTAAAPTVTNSAVINKVLTGYTSTVGTVAATDNIVTAIGKLNANSSANANATHTGDATGATALTVKGINGTLLSGLSTGILKNTTTTGVPSIAVAADFPVLNQNTTGSAASFTGSLAGDVTGTQGATVVGKLQGKSVSTTAPTNGQVLKYNTTTSAWEPATDAGISSTLNSANILVGNASNVATAVAMSGDATMDNAGALAIGANAITSAKIADGTIANADVSTTAAIAGTKISPDFGTQAVTTTGNVTGADIVATGADLILGVAATTGSQGNIVFHDGLTTAYVALRAPLTVTASHTLTLPVAAGTADQVLKTDASGNLGWVNQTAAATDATTTAKGIVQLAGDLSGTAAAPTVKGINGTLLSGLSTGILKNTTTTGVPSIAVAADFPVLNQNTTGTAASFTGSLAGDVTGTQGATVVTKLQGKAVSTTAPTNGQVLKYNTTTSAWEPATDAGISSTLNSANILVGNATNVATAVAMSGDATMDNAGALTIGADKITSAKIADGTIVTGDIATGGVTSANIFDGTIATADVADGAVTAAKLNAMGATNGQVLKYNATTSFWEPATASLPAFATTAGVTSNSPGTLATDDFVFGQTLLDGTGYRMFFDKSKGAFRVGRTTTTSWDDTNRGDFSLASGYNTTANNTYSTAFGNTTTASGVGSLAFGSGTTASGNYSLAFGVSTTASGSYSLASGDGTKSLGSYSSSFGSNSTADSYLSTVFGRYNVGGGTATGWVSTDPLFEIGNGTSGVALSNALTVLKNGNTTIGGDAVISGADLTLGVGSTSAAGTIVFNDAAPGTLTATIKAPASVTASYTLTLPATAGAVDQVLKTDASGNLGWVNQTAAATDATTTAKGIVQLAGDLSGTAAAPTVKGINGTALSGLTTGILKNTTATGVPSIAVASDFPVLNQNTTGTAASFTGSLAGDVTGTQGATVVTKLQGKSVSTTAPTNGQVLKYNTTTSVWEPNTDNGISSTLTSANILVGNASNVATAVTMSGDATLDNAGVLTIGTGKVTSSDILDLTIANADVSATAAIAGTKISPDFGAQNVVTTGTLGSGAITSSGNIAANGGSLTTNQTTGNLMNTTATTLNIGGAATTTNIGASAGTTTVSNNLTLGSGTGLAAGAINLNDGTAANSFSVSLKAPTAVTASYGLTLPAAVGASGQVLQTTDAVGTLGWTTPSTTTVVDGLTSTSTTSALSANQGKVLNDGKLDKTLSSTNIFVGNGTNVATAVSMSGDATLSNAGALTIGTDKITSAKILDGSIMNVDVNTGAAIAGTKISPDFGTQAVTTTGNVTGADIVATGADLTLGVAATAAAGSIVFNDGAVTTSTATLKAPAAVTASYTLTLPAAAGTVDQVLKTDASGNLGWVNQTAAATDATTTAKGIVQLAGDLSGTAAAPTVKGINGTALSALTTGILKNTTATGVPSIAVASDFPVLNQNTTGTAASFTGSLAGDVTGTQGATVVTKLQGKAVSTTAPTNGQVLKYNTTTSAWEPNTDSGISTTLNSANILVGNASNVATAVAMSGDATMDNAGALTIGASKITSAKILDGEIANADVSATAAIAGTKISPDFGAQNVVTTGYLLGDDLYALGSDLFLGNPFLTIPGAITFNDGVSSSSNSVKLIAPATVSTSYTLTLPAAAGTTGQVLKTDASGNLSWTTITTSDATTTATGKVQLAGDFSGTATAPTVKGINGTALSGLATGILKNTTSTGVPSIAVAADFPTLNQNTTGSAASFTGSLAGDVTGTQGATTVGKLQGRAVSATAPTNGQVLKYNTTNSAWEPAAEAGGISTTLNSANILVGNASNVATAVALSGDATITNSGVLSIGTGKVTSTNILDGTIITGDISTGGVTSTNILDGTIITGDISTGGVTSTNILDGTIITGDISTGGVTSTNILDGTIVTGDISTGGVTSTNILDGTIVTGDISTGGVTSTNILNGTILAADLNAMGATSGQVLKFDGSAWAPGAGGGAFATTSNVTSNSPGTIGTDDFVFGATSLETTAGYNLFLFDKSTGAFRAGYATANWTEANRGFYSFATGSNTKASGIKLICRRKWISCLS